ncbi:MAG: hypothetical protein QG602_130 [Verrucomicrobiota bacterium]|nr:hypothetical protein [Verrucomicrobiota bacterium]
MKLFARPILTVLLPAFALSLVLLGWFCQGRRERIEHVSQLGAELATPDPASATGWAGNRRWLIASEHNNDSYQWIMETQQMLATGELRLRQVRYDNAVEPRSVSTPSPYRWWLAGAAKLRQITGGGSLPLAVERAALFADPLLLALALVAGGVLLARKTGPWPAAVWLVGGATLYPFSSAFIPGAPDSLGLSLLLAMASVLLPAAAWLSSAPEVRVSRAWMIAGGVAGGLGLWVNFFVQLPVLGGLALAALLAAALHRGDSDEESPRLWRSWGFAGAATCLAAWLIENAPDQIAWKLGGNHPAAALAWLGSAELSVLGHDWRTGRAPWAGWSGRSRALAALLGLAALGYFLANSSQPWLKGREVFGTRLSSLPLAIVAENFPAWLRQEGPKLQLIAVLLPLSLLAVPLTLVFRVATGGRDRTALLLVLVPLLPALVFAWFQLRWWAAVTGLLLAVLSVGTALLARRPGRLGLPGWLVALGLCLLPGLLFQKPIPKSRYENALTAFEVEGLMERSLAHWLTARTGTTPVVLAPPFRTTALAFHGNLHALGSLNLANKPALEAAARIASATTPEEAQALIAKRGLTHIVMPTWDNYLEEYARLFTSRPENSFVFALKNWAMPPWLLPVPYQLPTVGGFENQTVFIFEVAEEQDAATAVSRLAEYFLETDQGQLALSAATALVNYPENLPALAALAQIEMARGDAARFQTTLKTLLSVYQAGEEHDLSWDRRVSLAVVLMQGKQAGFARREMEICLSLMDEARLRSLTVGSLYRFQVLLRALNLRIEDEKLHTLARSLLPDGLRARLQ